MSDPRAYRIALALAWIALSVAAAHALQTTLATLALGPGPLWAALGAGSYAGQRPASAVAHTVPLAALCLLLGAVALGAPSGPGLARSPWTRLLAVLAPLVLSPWVLAQDDVLRRPSLLAFTLGGSVAAAVWLRGAGRVDAPAKGWRGDVPMLAAIVAHAALFSYLAITRDRALWSATVDLGIFKEALWNTLHGRPMYSPTVGYSFLGEHFSPVLFLLAPLYALSPTSECLLIVQTVAISASAWPVYRLGRELGLRRDLATVLAAAMIFSPQMQVALLYDFHMDLLAVPALCALALALHRRRWGAAALAAALAASVKEDMFIPAVAVLLARAASGERSDRRRAAALTAAVLAYCLVAMFVLLKRFGPPPGTPVYMSDGSEVGGYKYLRNFRHLAVNGGPLRALLGQPVRFVLYAFSDARLTTLLSFVAPLALLPFAAGARVVLLMPLGIVLLSDNPEIVALRYHYAAVQHPGIFLAAVYGAARAVRSPGEGDRRSLALLSFVLAAATVMAATHPSSMASRVHPTDTRAVTPRVRAVTAMLGQIPGDAPVSVSTWLGPRVSNRPWGVIFPYGLNRATWAAVDLQRPPWPQTFEQRDEMVRGMLRGRWAAVSWHDGAVVMRRDADPSRNVEAMRDLFARRRYEVEGTEQTDFPNCAVRDARASDGWARVVRDDDPRPPGFVVFGPFIRLPAGAWRVSFRLRAEPRHADDEVAQLDVFRNGRVLAARTLLGRDFDAPGWRDFSLEFSVDEAWFDALEFRVRTTRQATLGADYVSLRAVNESEAMARWSGL
ncbi:MAG: DUF2079 domain-containing protein [Polyangiales bacterium]